MDKTEPCVRQNKMTTLLKNWKFAWDYFVLGKHRNAHISPWVEPTPLEGQLWFGDLLVADLHHLSPHQGTWFSEYQLKIGREQGERQDQLLTYIAFCVDFNRRMAEGREHDFDGLDRFTSLSDCEAWCAQLPSGRWVPMEGRLLFTENEVSWQHPETEPSTEGAACEFWVKNSSKETKTGPALPAHDLHAPVRRNRS